MNSKNTYLITQPVFGVRENSEGKKLLNHSSIINYGEEMKNNKVSFINKDGKVVQNVSTFESSIKLFKIDDICLDNLMSKWKRQNNCSKPIVLDENINTFEVFENDFSAMDIMIDRRENEIAIKPIFK